MKITNLTIKTRKGRNLIKDLSIDINTRDKIAIIGEEGNGKSTLIKAIYSEALVSKYAEVSGIVDKKNKILGYLPQFIDDDWKNEYVYNFFLKETPYSEIDFEDFNKFSLIKKDLTKFDIDLKILESDQLISSLSGGELIKIQLIKILLKSPDILLLDEPTNDLDIDTLEWIENFILKTTKPVIYISHDEILLENTANKIIHIEQIKKKLETRLSVETTDYKTYINNRKRSLLSQEQRALSERRNLKKQIEKFNKVYQKVEHQQNQAVRDPSLARLLAKKMKSLKSMEKRFENQELTEIPLIEEAITFFFDKEIHIPNGKVVIDFKMDELKIDDKTLCENINLKIVGPEKIVIIGKNGIGKTTLLKEIIKKLGDTSNIKVGVFPQNYEELLDFNKTGVRFLLDYFPHLESKIRSFMGSMNFTKEEMIRDISSYSGGQKAKIILLKLIIDKCNVLVLDEPTRNFSPLSNPVIRESLIDYSGCIISVSHDRKYIYEVCEKVYKLTKVGLIM